MATYALRALNYFIALVVLCALMMALMIWTGYSALTAEQTVELLFTDRFLMLGIAIVALSLTYPKFGFITRTTEGNLEKHRQQVLTAFDMSGFKLQREENGVLYFQGNGLLKRLSLLFEDEIRVEQVGDQIRIEGIRRGVARTLYRLESYIEMANRNEK